MTLCFVTHLTLTICFSEAWLALQWAVTDSTKHSKQWGTGQLRGLEQKRERELAWFRNMWLLKYLSFIAWKHLNASLLHFVTFSLSHLSLRHPCLFPLTPPSHSSLHHLLGEEYPPGLWASFVWEQEMLAQPDHVSNFHFLKCLREHPGFYQCPLHWVEGGRSSSYLAGDLAINEQTTLSLSWDQGARTGPLHYDSFFAQRSLGHTHAKCIMRLP